MKRILRKFSYVKELEKKYIDLQMENINLSSEKLDFERKYRELQEDYNYMKDIIATLISAPVYCKHSALEAKAVISKSSIKENLGKLKIKSLFPEEKIELSVNKQVMEECENM